MSKILIAGALLTVFSLAITGCGDACAVCGTYVSQDNPNDYLELRPDGTFYEVEGELLYSGTWDVDGDKLTLNLYGFPSAPGTIQGNTITDRFGERWVRR